MRRGPDRPSRGLRLRQGLVLLSGAIAMVLAIGEGPSRFYWTPLALGLTYLAAALTGGRRGSYWATAVTLTGWGTAVVLAREARPDLDVAGLYLAGAGLGATAGILLARRGVAVDPLGATATIAAGGLVLALEPRWPGVLGDARTFALLIGAVGLANLLMGALGRDDGAAPVRPASDAPDVRRV